MHTIAALLLRCMVASAILLALNYLLVVLSDLAPIRKLVWGSAPVMEQPEIDSIICEDDTKNIKYWVRYSSGPGVTVFGLPSSGGIYVLRDCLGVELDFLGLDRFNNTPRPSEPDPDWQAKEDAHCDRIRRLGGTWWQSRRDAFLKDIFGSGPEMESFIRVGWTASGGAWVLYSTEGNARLIGAAMIQNANNMEERCKVIEQLGGFFYADPKDCPHLDLP